MKRSPALVKSSREHHTALSLALRIEKAGDAAARSEVIAALPAIFRDELEPHFREEERRLLPQLASAGEEALVGRALADHKQLRDLSARIVAGDLSGLQGFGALLREHVRFEERELFMVAQRVLPQAILESGGDPVSGKI